MVKKLLCLTVIALLLSFSLISCKDRDDTEPGNEASEKENAGADGKTDLPIDEFD